jgi:predicted component of type VI protein secretion system
MPVCLSVVNEEADEASESTYRFEETPIAIGRREENHLTLEDPKRIVSGRHAIIRQLEERYCLVDRESKNFTYVDDRRLPAGEPYELEAGDVFRVGDFRITFRGEDENRSVESGKEGGDVETETSSGPCAALTDALDTLAAAHRQLGADRREQAWRAAVGDTADPSTVRGLLREGVAALDGPAEAAQDPEASVPAPTIGGGTGGRVQPVIDGLAEAVAMMVRIPWRFRHEFIGQTMRRDPETAFLYRGEHLREALHEAAPTESARRRRLSAVKEAAEALVRHQVAMLEGYRAAVETGTDHLLSELDPDTHRREAAEDHPLYDYLPVLPEGPILDRIRDAWGEIRRADAATLERRVFRPAFTKAYLAHMTAPPSEDDSGETSPVAHRAG